MKYYLYLATIIISIGLSSSTEDNDGVVNPPLEVYIIDVPELPKATSVKGTSYSASIYVVDNLYKEVYGPYMGSSYPNSKETIDSSGNHTDRPSTVMDGAHLFNNKFGHKGGTKKGLNLINPTGKRIVDGFSWTHKPTKVVCANVHSGLSDKGNYNSRGSMGCMTIHPADVDTFFSHFDFSKSTKGNAEGVLYIFRDKEDQREKLAEQIQSLFKKDNDEQ